MKKLIWMMVCITVIFTNLSFTFAEAQVVEKPAIKIVIDGEVGTYSSLPIIAEGRTFLPLREILVNLGVPNDNEHIIWNGTERSVTINKDSTKIYLKVASKQATVNDVSVALDVAPIIYKDRTYIPARFVAESLNRKVLWDAGTNTIAIYDEESFNKVKDLIGKINTAMNKVSKQKAEMATDMTMAGVKSSSFTIGEKDKVNMVKHIFEKNIESDKTVETDVYYFNNEKYVKEGEGSWTKTVLSDAEFSKFFEYSVGDHGDVVNAGMVVVESSDPDELLIDGDIGFDAFLNSKEDSTYKPHTLIIVDKNTFLCKFMSFDHSGTNSAENQEMPYTVKATALYTTLDNDYEVKIPEELK